MAQGFQKELDFIKTTVKNAYQRISHQDYHTTDKAEYDIVTAVDLEVERFIIEEIKLNYPDDAILSEETMHDTVVHGRTWTIDPIDGTFNFANDMSLYGIQCALYHKGEPVVSAIYLPAADELYWAEKGRGAYLNGNRIQVKYLDLQHSLVSFGDLPHARPNEAETELAILGTLSKKIAKIRMFGAASIDFSYVASGKITGTVIFTKNKWDIAPGILLCQEAGAVVKSLDGAYTPDSPSVIACASEELYQEIIACLYENQSIKTTS